MSEVYFARSRHFYLGPCDSADRSSRHHVPSHVLARTPRLTADKRARSLLVVSTKPNYFAALHSRVLVDESSAQAPPFFLGIDLGGTNIKSGVVDNNGRPLSSVSVPTHADAGPVAGLDSLVAAGELAVKESGLRWDLIESVGLGSPGTMDLKAGMLLDPPNLPGWSNLPIRQLLSTRLTKPTVLQNDANAASYGEYWTGAGKEAHSLVMFTLGTGIGCGIVVDARSSRGGTAMEASAAIS